MKTNQEILDRYLSNEVDDLFEAQKTALICMLPYDMAKPYLDDVYRQQHEDGTLPEGERWTDEWDLKGQILDFLPQIYKTLATGDDFNTSIGLLYIKTWIWAEDESFFDIVEPLYDKLAKRSDIKELLDIISKHYGYEESVTDIPFEELPAKNIESDLSS